MNMIIVSNMSIPRHQQMSGMSEMMSWYMLDQYEAGLGNLKKIQGTVPRRCSKD